MFYVFFRPSSSSSISKISRNDAISSLGCYGLRTLLGPPIFKFGANDHRIKLGALAPVLDMASDAVKRWMKRRYRLYRSDAQGWGSWCGDLFVERGGGLLIRICYHCNNVLLTSMRKRTRSSASTCTAMWR